MKKRMLSKGLVFSVILLFLELAVSPSINANFVDSNKEITTFEINFFTLKGVKKIEKEIPIEDAQYLLDLMDGSDYKEIALESNRLSLLPDDFCVEQVEDLISGNYGKEKFKDFEDKLKLKPCNNPKIKRNSFCIVSGNALDNNMYQIMQAFMISAFILPGLFLMLLDMYLTKFPWYPEYLYSAGPLFFLGFIIGMFGASIGSLSQMIPLRIMAISYAYLEDSSLPPYDYPNVNTTGLLGKWWMHEFEIKLNMLGFLGVWLNYNDGINDFACNFMGFALYVNAKGYNETT